MQNIWFHALCMIKRSKRWRKSLLVWAATANIQTLIWDRKHDIWNARQGQLGSLFLREKKIDRGIYLWGDTCFETMQSLWITFCQCDASKPSYRLCLTHRLSVFNCFFNLCVMIYWDSSCWISYSFYDQLPSLCSGIILNGYFSNVRYREEAVLQINHFYCV